MGLNYHKIDFIKTTTKINYICAFFVCNWRYDGMEISITYNKINKQNTLNFIYK